MTIIDVWGQVMTERMARAPWLATLMRWTGGQRVASSVPATIAAMDEAGVDVMLISAWHGPEGSLISNDEVAAQIDQAPTRLRGLATVDLADPMGAAREIRRRVDGERFVGVRCGTCRRTTGAIIRSTPPASRRASRSAPRSAIPAR